MSQQGLAAKNLVQLDDREPRDPSQFDGKGGLSRCPAADDHHSLHLLRHDLPFKMPGVFADAHARGGCAVSQGRRSASGLSPPACD